MTPQPPKQSTADYKRLLSNAQHHLLDSYKTKFGEDADFEAIWEATEAARVMADPQKFRLQDGGSPSKFTWVQDGKKRRVVWA